MRKPWTSEPGDRAPEWSVQCYGHGLDNAEGFFVKVHVPEQHLTPEEARKLATALMYEANRASIGDNA